MDLGVVNPRFRFNVTDNAFSKFFIRDIDRDKNHSAHKTSCLSIPSYCTALGTFCIMTAVTL
jgi:hypothetical protein